MSQDLQYFPPILGYSFYTVIFLFLTQVQEAVHKLICKDQRSANVQDHLAEVHLHLWVE